MTEGTRKEFPIIHCDVCKNEIPSESVRDFAEKRIPDLMCENCGTDLSRNIQPLPRMLEKTLVMMNHDNTPYKGEESSEFTRVIKEFTQVLRRFDENRGGNKKDFNASVLSISEDIGQPFIISLHLLVLRMIYHIYEKNGKRMYTKPESISNFAKGILSVLKSGKPIKNEKILKDLNEFPIEEVRKKLLDLKKKLILNFPYRVDFTCYLEWMVRNVLEIIENKLNATELNKFEQLIVNDIKHFFFEKEKESELELSITNKNNKKRSTVKRGGTLTDKSKKDVCNYIVDMIMSCIEEEKDCFNDYFKSMETSTEEAKKVLDRLNIDNNSWTINQTKRLLVIIGFLIIGTYKNMINSRAKLVSKIVDFEELDHSTISKSVNSTFSLLNEVRDTTIYIDELGVFNFLDNYQPELEKIGEYVTWNFFKETARENQDFILMSEKYFSNSRNNWVKSCFNGRYSTFRKYKEHLQLNPEQTTAINDINFIPSIHKDITVKEIIDPILNKYKTMEKKYKQTNISVETRTKKELKKIYLKRSLYLWKGIIYKITQIKDVYNNPIANGKFIIGYCTTPFIVRWYHYKLGAIKYNEGGDFNELLRNLNKNNFILTTNKLNKKGEGFIGDIFTWEILEICWDVSKLRKREDDWIKLLDARDPTIGFNKNPGGWGGTKIHIDFILLVRQIANGYDMARITENFNKINQYPISYDVIKSRMHELYGGIRKARIKFLKPVLKIFIQLGFEMRIIASKFEGINNASTISEWCKKFFGGKFEDVRGVLVRERLIELVSRGYNVSQISDEIPGLASNSLIALNRDYLGYFGGLERARLRFLKPKLEESIINGLSDEEIVDYMGFTLVRTHYKTWLEGIEIIEYYVEKFWNMSIEQVRSRMM